jgi:hypothetical protein
MNSATGTKEAKITSEAQMEAPQKPVTSKSVLPGLTVPRSADSKNWYIVLHLVKGMAQPQGDWSKEMKVGDTAQFVSPDGEVEVLFTPMDGHDQQDKPITGLNPFGSGQVAIRGDGEIHTVRNSCMSNMTCRVIDTEDVVHTYKGSLSTPTPISADGDDEGTHVCTGGGNTPVVCT